MENVLDWQQIPLRSCRGLMVLMKKGPACKCQYFLLRLLYWAVNLLQHYRYMRKILLGIYCSASKSHGLEIFIAVHVPFFDLWVDSIFLSSTIRMTHQKAPFPAGDTLPLPDMDWGLEYKMCIHQWYICLHINERTYVMKKMCLG